MDVPAGWYPDPASSTSARWWDGTSWTEHTLPLDALPTAPQGPAYAAPEAATVVVPVAAQAPEFVPPFVPADVQDTAVYPLGPSYDGSSFPAAPEPPRRTPGWGVLALVGLLAVVLVAAAVLVVKSLGSGSGGPSASSPTGSARPGASGSGGSSAGGGSGGSATASQAARVLETFKPSAATLPAGIEVTLIPQGDVAQGQRTLDGWCSSSYATEKDRIARRQWALTQGGQSIGLSVEAVAYATPEQAAAALAEFRRTSDACRNVTVDEDGAAVTQDVTSLEEMTGLPEGITGYRARMTASGTGTDGTAFTGSSTSTVQRKGQYLTIVWSNQSTPVSAGDQQVIDRFVAEQTQDLAATS